MTKNNHKKDQPDKPEPKEQPTEQPAPAMPSQEELEVILKKAAERDEFLAMLQRKTADFSNFQKRVGREKECAIDYSKETIFREILEIVDNFDLAVSTCKPDTKADCILEGMVGIHKQLLAMLEKNGVKPVKSLGEPFSPETHEAIVTEPSQDKDNIVTGEFRKGYEICGRVLRPARVKVAVKAEKHPPQEPAEDENKADS